MMTSLVELSFWICVVLIFYTYWAYPVAIAIAARLCPRPVRPTGPRPTSVSIVLALYNEEKAVAPRLEELTGILAASGAEGEIVVISDGSTDGTADRAREFASRGVRVLELPTNLGKAAALTRACSFARNEILVFADARQKWCPEAIDALLENFADPDVGGVSGDLVLQESNGLLAGLGLYWNYERWLRRNESLVGSAVGVTGAICAVRRKLFRPIPPGTILDDVYWPLQVVLQGYRIVRNPRALAYDQLPKRASDEYHRKVRTLAGNYQLLLNVPGALLPWRNPIWIQFISHKVLRLLVPWAMVIALASSALLPGKLYQAAFLGQLALYLLGLVGLISRAASRLRGVSAAASFLILHAAAAAAAWVCMSGRSNRSWKKVQHASVDGNASRSAVGGAWIERPPRGQPVLEDSQERSRTGELRFPGPKPGTSPGNPLSDEVLPAR
jgi:cellulose synthase/poly-beta-1,6-N-acetylglucosamine synthase-like glycosyltransferase